MAFGPHYEFVINMKKAQVRKQQGRMRPPLISFAELCDALSVKRGELAYALRDEGAPKPKVSNHNKTWYDKAEVLRWWAALETGRAA